MDKWIQVLLVIVVGVVLVGFCGWQYSRSMELSQLRRWAREDGYPATDRGTLRARYAHTRGLPDYRRKRRR